MTLEIELIVMTSSEGIAMTHRPDTIVVIHARPITLIHLVIIIFFLKSNIHKYYIRLAVIKTLLTIDEHGSKIERNNVFDCHLSLILRQMTIENSVYYDFLSTFVGSINVYDCHLSGVSMTQS